MGRLAKLVADSIDRLSLILATISGVLITVVVFIVVYGVVLRYVLRSPAGWAVELPTFLFLALVALALAYVQRLRGHIGVEILAMRFPERARTVLQIVSSTALLIYACLLAWASWIKALDHLQAAERSDVMGIPLFAVQIIIPVACFILCLQALVGIGKDVAELMASKH